MPPSFWHKALTPSRLVLALGLLTVTCTVLIANFSIRENGGGHQTAARTARVVFVHDVVAEADSARAALRQYEATQSPADRAAFLQACNTLAAKVADLRSAEHLSADESDQIVDLCVGIRAQLARLGNTPAAGMANAAGMVDRIRRVILGFGMDELRRQDESLARQTQAAALNGRLAVGAAAIEVFLVCSSIFLAVRLARLEQLVTVCAWSHRVLYDGRWMKLSQYLRQRFGIGVSNGITPEQAGKLMAENEVGGQELVRLIEFEKAAGDKATEVGRSIHAMRNHLTAVLCYSELASTGDQEAQREMAKLVLSHASTIAAEITMLHEAVQSFKPGRPDLHVVPMPQKERAAA